MHCSSPNGSPLKWSLQIILLFPKSNAPHRRFLLLVHKTPILPMLIRPPNMIHLTLQEWCLRLVSATPVHQNALPVEENLHTISVAADDFEILNQ